MPTDPFEPSTTAAPGGASAAASDERADGLGAFLRGRRSRLDPVALGYSRGRRRTPGLRREEVALRANISPTWYTWLEQGRGGAPSADVLDRLARGLMLSETEREHLFLLGLGRPPVLRPRAGEGVSPRLQKVLDALISSPAIVKTASWDIVAWNRAATVLLTDYAALPPQRRNVMRLMFADAGLSGPIRARQEDWWSVARFVVGTFRTEAARAGAEAMQAAARLAAELSTLSPEFAELWAANEVISHGEGVKRLLHPAAGAIALEYSAFAVDGRPDLGMVVYNPQGEADARKVAALLAAAPG